ncbi:MAG: RodZ domain-containing protein [Dictyoglomaceae bacterium]
MTTLGELLRKERESQGKDLRQIALELKISSRYLEALEQDKFDEVNLADIYKKGIIKKYSRYLNIDEKFALDLYEQQYEKPILEENKKEEKREQTFIFFIYIIVGIIILTSIYIVHRSTSNLKLSSTPLTYTYPTFTEIIKESHTPTIVSEISKEKQKLSHNIKLVAHDRTWLRVFYDNNIVFEGILLKGDVKIFTYSYLDLHIGNAGGIEIFYDDKSLGILGKKGEVIIKRVP